MNQFNQADFSQEERAIENFFGDEAPDKMLYLGALDIYNRLEGETRGTIHKNVDGALNTNRLDRMIELYAGSVGYLVQLKMEAQAKA